MVVFDLEEQKEKTYIELYNLLSYLPLKYNVTRKAIRELMSVLDSEVWKISDRKNNEEEMED